MFFLFFLMKKTAVVYQIIRAEQSLFDLKKQ